MIDSDGFNIGEWMRTEGIPYLLEKARARGARVDGGPQVVVRLDAEDSVSAAARSAEERLATLGVRTDSARDEALERLALDRAQREWLDQFTLSRLARADAERESADVEAARQAAERRIN